MTRILTLLLLLAWVSTAPAAEPVSIVKPRDVAPLILPRNPSNRPPPPAVLAQIEKFFTTMQTKDIDGAFKEFLKDADELRRKYDVNDFIEKTKYANDMYGPVQGFELFDNKPVGSRIIYLTYFVYHKAIPVRWRFIFYAPDGTGYKLVNLSVDDLLDQSVLAE